MGKRIVVIRIELGVVDAPSGGDDVGGWGRG